MAHKSVSENKHLKICSAEMEIYEEDMLRKLKQVHLLVLFVQEQLRHQALHGIHSANRS